MGKNRKTFSIIFVSILMLLILGYIYRVVIVNNQNAMVTREEEIAVTEVVEEEPEYPQLQELKGGYVSTEEIVVDNYKITVFEIRYDSKNQVIAKVFFRLANTLDYTKSSFVNCPNPIVTPEMISLKSLPTPIGVISYEGIFSPKKEKYWGMPPGTVVLKGKMVIENNGKVIYSKDHEFTFTFGE